MVSKVLLDAGFKNVEEFAESIQGTCDGSVHHEVDIMDLSYDEIQTLDEIVFNCVSCGWWFGLDEACYSIDGNICTHCYEYENEQI